MLWLSHLKKGFRFVLKWFRSNWNLYTVSGGYLKALEFCGGYIVFRDVFAPSWLAAITPPNVSVWVYLCGVVGMMLFSFLCGFVYVLLFIKIWTFVRRSIRWAKALPRKVKLWLVDWPFDSEPD